MYFRPAFWFLANWHRKYKSNFKASVGEWKLPLGSIDRDRKRGDSRAYKSWTAARPWETADILWYLFHQSVGNNLLLLWQQWMAPEEEDVKLSVAVLRHITSSCLSFYNSFTTSLIPGVNSATKWTMVAVDIHKIPFYGSNTDLEESADVCGRSMLRLNCELLCNLDQ